MPANKSNLRVKSKLFNRLTCLILSASFVGTVFANTSNDKGTWRNEADLPYRIQEIYPVLYNNHIFVAGGLSPDTGKSGIGVSRRVVVYDLDTKQWRDGPDLPEPRHHPMLVTVNNRLLSFGGFVKDDRGMWHNSRDVLELVVDKRASKQKRFNDAKWKKIAELPEPLAETLSAVNKGKVHLVTGRTPSNSARNSQWIEQKDVNTHYVFDPVNLSWTKAESAPTSRNSACAVSSEDNLYTIAGRTVRGGNLANHEAYNFKTKTWTKLAPMPQAQGGLACAIVGEHIYVFGGEYFDNGGGVYKEVWQYDIASNKWSKASEMPNPRHGLGALNIDGEIYLIAGASEAGGKLTSTAMSVFTPAKL